MAFLKRLGFYLIGLSIGLVFLVVFLKNKSRETGTSFCYLPNCRVLKELRSKPMTYSPKFQGLMASGRIDSLGISDLLSNGDVDFSLSDTKGHPYKTYLIRGIQDTKNVMLTVEHCGDSIVLKSLEFQE